MPEKTPREGPDVGTSVLLRDNRPPSRVTPGRTVSKPVESPARTAGTASRSGITYAPLHTSPTHRNLMLFAWSSASYVVPLPPGHRFPMAKYRLLKERVIDDGIIPPSRVLEPDRAPRDDVRLVHTDPYVEDIDAGRLDGAAERRLGFPWSPALVERSYRSVGGTIAASRAALEHGIAINLSGGTHHAFADHGEGFCVFNDVAI